MPITDFIAMPNKVKLNEIAMLESTFTEDEGVVVYEIADDSPITFVDGLLKIQADIQDKKDSTTTTLQGPKGGVRISAYRQDKPNDKIVRLVRLI